MSFKTGYATQTSWAEVFAAEFAAKHGEDHPMLRDEVFAERLDRAFESHMMGGFDPEVDTVVDLQTPWADVAVAVSREDGAWKSDVEEEGFLVALDRAFAAEMEGAYQAPGM